MASIKNCSCEQFGSGDALKMLEMHVAVETEAALDFGDDVRSALERVVHVVTGFKVARCVGELTTAELGDLVDLGAFGFEFFGDGGDEVINAAFEGFGIKDDQALVFATHWIEVGVVVCECGIGSPQWRFLGTAQAARLREPWQACFQEVGVRRVKTCLIRGRPCFPVGCCRCRF